MRRSPTWPPRTFSPLQRSTRWQVCFSHNFLVSWGQLGLNRTCLHPKNDADNRLKRILTSVEKIFGVRVVLSTQKTVLSGLSARQTTLLRLDLSDAPKWLTETCVRTKSESAFIHRRGPVRRFRHAESVPPKHGEGPREQHWGPGGGSLSYGQRQLAGRGRTAVGAEDWQ